MQVQFQGNGMNGFQGGMNGFQGGMNGMTQSNGTLYIKPVLLN